MASQMQIIEQEQEILHGINVVQRILSALAREILNEGNGKVYPENKACWEALAQHTKILTKELQQLTFSIERAME